MDETDINWVELGRFSWYQDALMVKLRLEGNGIKAEIPEQFTGTIDPGITGMQVRVVVREEQYEEAKVFLTSLPPETKKETCEKCGSTELISKPKTGQNWFRAFIGLLLMIPMRRRSERICKNCGTPV